MQVKQGILQLWISVLGLLLVGCTIAPGSNISSISFDQEVVGTTSRATKVSRVLISPEVNIALDRSRTANPISKLPAALSNEKFVYRIGPGDVLSVVVWDHPELTAPFGSFNNAQEQGNVVREDGTIYYPFIGSVQAQGRTALEIRDELEIRLSKYIESPQIDVRVAGYRSQRFFVAGSVERPGIFAITDVPITVVEAINAAGGVIDTANLFDVRLTRGEASFVIPLYEIFFNGETSSNILVRHGDVIHVAPNERRQAFIMGEVLRPQNIPLTNRPMSLTQALAMAGGIQEARADGRGIYVIRNSEYDDVVDVYQLDMANAWALALGDDFVLEPRDVVYVSAAPITRWNRWVSNVLPSLQGLFNIDRVGRN